MNLKNSPQWHHRLNSAVIALAFIGAGILILGRNMGWIAPAVTDFFVSWEMILVIIGVVCLAKRNYTGGFILIALGAYFLMSHTFHLRQFWPLFLIGVGIALLIRARNKGAGRGWPFQHHRPGAEGRPGGWQTGQSASFGGRMGMEEGFVVSDVTFSSARHIVLEPVFKGADLDVTFGSIVLDLRRTRLDVPQTLIQLDATFSGVELYIPATWNVAVEADTTLSGFKDRRFLSQPVDTEHKLIIRGDITFSGVDIKS